MDKPHRFKIEQLFVKSSSILTCLIKWCHIFYVCLDITLNSESWYLSCLARLSSIPTSCTQVKKQVNV